MQLRESDWKLTQALMNRYANLPLDLADASLICAAEQLGDYKLFTIDQAMRVVRLQNGSYFDVLPQPVELDVYLKVGILQTVLRKLLKI